MDSELLWGLTNALTNPAYDSKTVFGEDQGYLKDNHTAKELTQTQLESLNYCIFGHWDKIVEVSGKTGEPTSFDSRKNKVTSLLELSSRNTSTNVKSRILLSTYYIDLENEISGFDQKQVLCKLNKQTIDVETAGYVSITSSEYGLRIVSITNLKTNLWTDGKPDWATYQNRAFMVDGIGDGATVPDKIWTDGTTVYNIGIDAPTSAATNVSASSTGGYLTDGVYLVKYSFYRSTNYTCESNLSPVYSVTLSGGTTTQKFTVRVYPTTDAQVDEIKLYRTKVGDVAYYYESVVDDSVDSGKSYKTVKFGSYSDSSLSTLADNNGLGNDNDRPEYSNYICAAANRMWYATANYVYYSKVDKPEQVPAINRISFDPDDGEMITNISAFSNYIMVQKETKTWIIDANNPDMVNPIQLSNNIGCIAKKTFCVCGNGQEVIWLSQEGFYWSDGVKVDSICKGKNYLDLMRNIDRNQVKNSMAIYYPNEAQYISYVPYLNSQYRIWVYNLLSSNWVRFDYAIRPNSVALFTDIYDIKRFVYGAVIPGVESGKRSWFSHLFLADKDDHFKDISVTATCALSTALTYSDINMRVITSWDTMGMGEFVKSFRSIHTNWEANGAVTGNLTISTDYGAKNSGTIAISHAGYINEPVVTDWKHGYLYLKGWDYQTSEYDKEHIPELSGTNFSLKFSETSDHYVEIYDFTLYFQSKGYRVE